MKNRVKNEMAERYLRLNHTSDRLTDEAVKFDYVNGLEDGFNYFIGMMRPKTHFINIMTRKRLELYVLSTYKEKLLEVADIIESKTSESVKDGLKIMELENELMIKKNILKKLSKENKAVNRRNEDLQRILDAKKAEVIL